MIELITAKEQSTFSPGARRSLGQAHAPLDGVQSGTYSVFRKGRSVSKTNAGLIVIHAAGGDYRADQKDALITQIFDSEMAHRLSLRVRWAVSKM